MWRQSPAMFGVTARSMPWSFQPPRHPRHAVILHPSFIFSIHQNGNVITPIITLQTETCMTFFMLGNGKKVTDTILDRSMPAHCMPSVFFLSFASQSLFTPYLLHPSPLRPSTIFWFVSFHMSANIDTGKGDTCASWQAWLLCRNYNSMPLATCVLSTTLKANFTLSLKLDPSSYATFLNNWTPFSSL